MLLPTVLLPTVLLPTFLLTLAILFVASTAAGEVAGGSVLEDVRGVVELRERSGAAWRPAALHEALASGSSLRSFQGDARFSGRDALFMIASDSELTLTDDGLAGLRGRLYGRSLRTTLDVGLPLHLLGEGRIDALDGGSHRVAMFDGEALAELPGGLVRIAPGEQLYLPANGDAPVLSSYFERDPWYRDVLALDAGGARVEAMHGRVELADAAGDWRAAVIGDTLAVDERVRTHAGAWLELRFDDGNLVRLQPESELRLVRLQEYDDGTRHTALELLSGSVWAVVVTRGQPFEIETPGLVAGVRGTTFRLDAPRADRPAQLKVFEGRVIGITTDRGVPVAAGETYSPGDEVLPLEPDPVDEFNRERDEERGVKGPHDGTPPGAERRAEAGTGPRACPPGRARGLECEEGSLDEGAGGEAARDERSSPGNGKTPPGTTPTSDDPGDVDGGDCPGRSGERGQGCERRNEVGGASVAPGQDSERNGARGPADEDAEARPAASEDGRAGPGRSEEARSRTVPPGHADGPAEEAPGACPGKSGERGNKPGCGDSTVGGDAAGPQPSQPQSVPSLPSVAQPPEARPGEPRADDANGGRGSDDDPKAHALPAERGNAGGNDCPGRSAERRSDGRCDDDVDTESGPRRGPPNEAPPHGRTEP